jgi:hypothetical protein
MMLWITRSFSAGPMNTVIRVYDESGNLIATHEQAGGFKNSEHFLFSRRVGRLILSKVARFIHESFEESSDADRA